MESNKGADAVHSPLTHGIDHVGLTVRDCAVSSNFFCECLGWKLVGENASYPAKFVSDGTIRLTLWQVQNPANCRAFDRKSTIGLHHLAFKATDLDNLRAVYARIAEWPGVVIEFAPELSGSGPKWHCMFLEPGGNRIEIAYDPR